MSPATRFRAGVPLLEDAGHVVAPRSELDQIHREIQHEVQTGVRKYFALSGPRMTGKTTLVHSLRKRLERSGIPLHYVDLGPTRGRDLDSLYRHLEGGLLLDWHARTDLAVEDGPGGRHDPNVFMRFLHTLSERTPDKQRAVIALDEVGAVDRVEVAGPFFAAFRGLLNDYKNRYWRYLFLFIGALDLYELPNGALSPLLNVCMDIRIGNLTREAVGDLIEPVAMGDPSLAEETYRLTDGHPYLTQRLGEIYEGQREAGGEIDVESAARMLVGTSGDSSTDPYLGHIFRYLERNQQTRNWVRQLLEPDRQVPFSGPQDPAMYRPALLGISARGADGNCRFANRVVEMAVRRYFKAKEPPRIGRYEILEKIYESAHSILYRSRHPDLGIPLVIKTLPEELFESKSDVARFQLEAKLLMEIRHPYICPVYDFGRQDRAYYIVMKFLQGGTYLDYLTGKSTQIEEKSASWTGSHMRVLRMLVQIADAIHHAHSRGVVHRDLKPSNVMIDMSPEGPMPVVIDFGLAKNLFGRESSALSREQMIVGTLAYLSPELADGDQKAVGRASDVYQLGALLYQILTGEAPHANASLPRILKKLALEEQPSPDQKNPEVDPRLVRICQRAMRREPGERHPDAAGFRDELSATLQELHEEGDIHG